MIVKTCNCKHDYQDKKYGKGSRVHNNCKQDTMARCTVCSNEIYIVKQAKKGK